MKPNYLLTSMLVAATIVVASCSAPKLAQQAQNQDDVYATKAVAKEYVEREVQEVVAQDSDQTNEYYGLNNPYFDMNYSSRINRFYYTSPWRSYYDDFYDYSYYPNYSLRSFSLIFSPFYYNGWGGGYYGNYPYYGYNYYGHQPFWGGGYYGGGYYGGGYYGGGYYGNIGGIINYPVANANYGSRPERGSENGVSYNPAINNPSNRPTGGAPVTGRPDRSTLPGYNPGTNSNNYGRPERSGTTTTNTNPATRPTTTAPAGRPTRTNDQQSRPTYTPPPAPIRTESRPPTTSSGGSSGSSGGSSTSGGRSTGGGGGDTRPTRGGGR